MGDDRKSAGWGQLNGKPIYKNLNADSTHPRPWRPPTDFDVLKRFYDPYPIFTHMGPQYFKRSHNWVEDDPFMSNLYWASKKGFGIGKRRIHSILSVGQSDTLLFNFFQA